MNCVLLTFFAWNVAIGCSQLFCSDLLKREPLKYHPLRHCQRSTEYPIGAKNVPTLDKCVQFAENNNALAFNYGHGRKPKNETDDHNLLNLFDKPSNKSTDVDDTEATYFNCEILACPEIGLLSKVVNDSRYDYYTLYANPIRESFTRFQYEEDEKHFSLFHSTRQCNV